MQEGLERKERIKKKWTKVKDEAIDYANFMENVNNGIRPTFSELKGLNKLKWNGYVNAILKETEINQ